MIKAAFLAFVNRDFRQHSDKNLHFPMVCGIFKEGFVKKKGKQHV